MEKTAEKENRAGAPGERFFYLDFIRVAATFLIVIYHFPLSLPICGVDVLHSTVNGRWGVAVVYVFFMISGAALFHRYGKGSFSLGNYYRRRFLSIYPLYYLAFVLGFFYVFWVRGQTYETVPSSAVFWTILGLDGYLNSVVPTFSVAGEWFIGAIILIYLLFPLFRQFYSQKAVYRTATAACGALALLIFAYNPFPVIEVKANLFVNLFFFLLGGELARGAVSGRTVWMNVHTFAASAAALFLWLFVPFFHLLFTESPAAFWVNLLDGINGIVLYAFLADCSVTVQRLPRLAAFAVRAARDTYGVFLIHHLVEAQICAHFSAAELTRRDTFVLLCLCLAAAAAAAFLLYSLYHLLQKAFRKPAA